MSTNSKIEWCDHTFNGWEGCQPAGPGCANCYAEARNKRFGGGVAVNWGPGAPRRRTSAANWALPVKWNKQEFWLCEECGQRGTDKDLALTKGNPCHHEMRTPVRQRVFCSSLSDVFDNAVDPMWRCELWDLIEATPNLDWLILTKRIGNARAMMSHMLDRASGWTPPANFWLGATIVNQAEADRDIPKLLAVPAAKRFLSMEPLLGPVSFDGMFASDNPADVTNMLEELDWVIVGGESGPNARPMDASWAQSLQQQCSGAGVPFFMKQMGGVRDKRGEFEDMPADLRVREFPNA